MQVGPYCLKNALFLAPMVGVTDRPFRQLCRGLGAGMALSEMVSSLAIHGRTRACGFQGAAEFDTVAAVKASVGIRVISNGDMGTPAKASKVLESAGAVALMIARAAQGNPWIFREIHPHPRTRGNLAPPGIPKVRNTLLPQTREFYACCGRYLGVRVARKHLSWYTKGRPGGAQFRRAVNRAQTRDEQQALIRDLCNGLEAGTEAPMVG
jgi:tRNA-dihydrouridine synthase B